MAVRSLAPLRELAEMLVQHVLDLAMSSVDVIEGASTHARANWAAAKKVAVHRKDVRSHPADEGSNVPARLSQFAIRRNGSQ